MAHPSIDLSAIAASFPAGEFAELLEIDVQSDTEVSISLFVPSSLKWFTGHFPEQPTLAGVVQVHWAIALSRQIFGISGSIETVQSVKFKSVIVPDKTLLVALTHRPDGNLVAFAYGNAGDSGSANCYSQGKIRFCSKDLV